VGENGDGAFKSVAMIYKRPKALVAKAVRAHLERGEKLLQKHSICAMFVDENCQTKVALTSVSVNDRAFLLMQAKSCLDVAQDAPDITLRAELLRLAADLRAKAGLQ
jgi:hypothetical protein